MSVWSRIRFISAMLSLAAVCLPASAETPPVKDEVIGQFLLVDSSDPYEVYSDGTFAGMTPLLLTLVAPARLNLTLRSGGVEISRSFQVSPFVKGVSTWRPEAPEARQTWRPPTAIAPKASAEGTARIDVSRLPKKANMILDGAAVEIPAGAAAVDVPAGVHRYRLEVPGRIPMESVIALEPGASVPAPSAHASQASGATALPRYVSAGSRKRLAAAGWLTVLAGAAVSVASGVLNFDGVSVGMSSGSYDSYEAIKYSSLAGLGLGATAAGVGLGLVIASK